MDYLKRSTDWAKSRPDGGVLLCLCESSVQVALVLCKGHEMSIVHLCVLRWETRRIDSRKKIEIKYESKKEILTPARFTQAGMLRRGSSIGFTRYTISLFEGRDSGFESKIRGRFGIDGMCRRWVAKINPLDYGRTHGEPSKNDSLLSPGLHYRPPVVSRFGKFHLNSHLSWPLSTPAI